MRADDVEVGSKHGRWTVTGSYQRLPSGTALFPCRCDCGTERIVGFRGFFSQSCGCLTVERSIERRTIHGAAAGGRTTKLYSVWGGMRARCSDPGRREYKNYGARGITVCAEWQEFIPFRDWALANGFSPNLQIDRIDNDGSYSPTNCRWVTPSQNLRNRRNNKLLTIFGETKCLTDWAEDPRCKSSYSLLETRIRHGWDPEHALTMPKGRWNPARSARSA